MAVVWDIEPWFQVIHQVSEVEIGASYRVTFNDREVVENPLFVEAVFLDQSGAHGTDPDFGYYSGWIRSISSVGRHTRHTHSDELYMIREETGIRPEGHYQHYRSWSRRFDMEDFEEKYAGVQSFSVVALIAPAYPGDVVASVVSRSGSSQVVDVRQPSGKTPGQGARHDRRSRREVQSSYRP